MHHPDEPLTKTELARIAAANSDAAILREIDRLLGDVIGAAGRLGDCDKKKVVVNDAGRLRARLRAVP